MFFKKKEKSEVLQEAPLGYWEEKSYMLAVPKDESKDLLEGVFERVAAIEGVEIMGKCLPCEEQPGKIILVYDGEEYEVGFYESDFTLPEMLGGQTHYFSEEEIAGMRHAKKALTVFMEFREDCKKSYHLQLKLVVAMVPELLGIMDESAEKMISARWAVMAANSSVTPGSNDLFMVQAISGKTNEVWLHTHGLCRCGISELEILQSDKKNYNNHHQVISTLGSYLLDKKEPFTPGESSAYIGVLTNEQPVVVTYLPWTEGLKEYKKLTLGGAADRKEGHNSRTGLVFAYKSEEDEQRGKLSKISEFDRVWGDNPVFFISNEETARMKALAMERFHFVKEQADNKDNKIIIKIGLLVDDADSNMEREHIWFELIAFEEDRFKARLLQEPYNVEGMHTGDEGWYKVEDVTDWMIYTPEFPVSPDKAYLLV